MSLLEDACEKKDEKRKCLHCEAFLKNYPWMPVPTILIVFTLFISCLFFLGYIFFPGSGGWVMGGGGIVFLLFSGIPYYFWNFKTRYVWTMIDVDGHYHRHLIDTYSTGTDTVEADRRCRIIGYDADHKPFLLHPDSGVFQCGMSGWSRWSHFSGASGWQIISTWGNKATIWSGYSPAESITFCPLDEESGKRMLEFVSRYPSLTHAFNQAREGQQVVRVVYKLNPFLSDKIDETKEGFGKSKHAKLVRLFLGRVDRILRSLTPVDNKQDVPELTVPLIKKLLEEAWTAAVAELGGKSLSPERPARAGK